MELFLLIGAVFLTYVALTLVTDPAPMANVPNYQDSADDIVWLQLDPNHK